MSALGMYGGLLTRNWNSPSVRAGFSRASIFRLATRAVKRLRRMFCRQILSASSSYSPSSTRAFGRFAAAARPMHPLPAQRSRMRQAPAPRAASMSFVASTSVSGRGMSTAGEMSSGRP